MSNLRYKCIYISSVQYLIFKRNYKRGKNICISDPKELPGSAALSTVAIPKLQKWAEAWVSLSTYTYVLICIVEEWQHHKTISLNKIQQTRKHFCRKWKEQIEINEQNLKAVKATKKLCRSKNKINIWIKGEIFCHWQKDFCKSWSSFHHLMAFWVTFTGVFILGMHRRDHSFAVFISLLQLKGATSFCDSVNSWQITAMKLGSN